MEKLVMSLIRKSGARTPEVWKWILPYDCQTFHNTSKHNIWSRLQIFQYPTPVFYRCFPKESVAVQTSGGAAQLASLSPRDHDIQYPDFHVTKEWSFSLIGERWFPYSPYNTMTVRLIFGWLDRFCSWGDQRFMTSVNDCSFSNASINNLISPEPSNAYWGCHTANVENGRSSVLLRLLEDVFDAVESSIPYRF